MTHLKVSYCVQVGPALCSYLYSLATLRHVSVTTTAIFREDNTTDQNKNTSDIRCLSCHAHIAIFRMPTSTHLPRMKHVAVQLYSISEGVVLD